MPEPDAWPAKRPVIGKSHVKHLHATKTVQCCEGLPAAWGCLSAGAATRCVEPTACSLAVPGSALPHRPANRVLSWVPPWGPGQALLRIPPFYRDSSGGGSGQTSWVLSQLLSLQNEFVIQQHRPQTLLFSFPAGTVSQRCEPTAMELVLLFVFRWHLAGGGQPKKYLKAVRGSEGRRKYYVFIVQVWFSHWLQRPAVSYMVKILIRKSFMMY